MKSERPTVLIVPGLRDESPDHWQTILGLWLASDGYKVENVAPIGKNNNSCIQRVDGLDEAIRRIAGPTVLVAHSGGCITVAHWAARRADTRHVVAALLAVPPDFETPMPAGYPSKEVLQAHAWLPVPKRALPFPSTVVASTNDPLASVDAVTELAAQWGSKVQHLGAVGHLNPASGFGPWPLGHNLVVGLLQGFGD